MEQKEAEERLRKEQQEVKEKEQQKAEEKLKKEQEEEKDDL